jgi:hypothetical protein
MNNPLKYIDPDGHDWQAFEKFVGDMFGYIAKNTSKIGAFLY